MDKGLALLAGDSFAEGVGATDKHGWAQMVAAAISERYSVRVYGEGGLTARGLRDRLDKLGGEAMNVVVLSIGINDSRYRSEADAPEVDPEVFRDDLRELLAFVRQVSPSAIAGVLQLINLDETRSTPLKEDKHYTTDRSNQFASIIREVAPEFSFDMIGVPRFDSLDHWADGVHPSDIGHRLIAESVLLWLQDFETTEGY